MHGLLPTGRITEYGGSIALGIQIHKQGPMPLSGKAIGQMHCSGGLSHSALLIGYCNSDHNPAFPKGADLESDFACPGSFH